MRARNPESSGRRSSGRRGPFQFLRTQRPAVRAVTAHLGAREHDLEPEMRLDLLAQALQRLSEKLFHFAARQTDHMRVFLLAPCFVEVPLARLMHQIELVDEPT